MAATLKYKELVKRFKELSKDLTDLSLFWDMVIPLIHNMTMGKFASAGPGWAPLAPSTIAMRIREGTWRVGVSSDQPILQREGDLRRSVMAKMSGGGANHIALKRKMSLTYGTNLKKAVYLQGDLEKWIPGASGSAYSEKLPPRPFLFFEDNDAEDILRQGVTYLEHELGKTFR